MKKLIMSILFVFCFSQFLFSQTKTKNDTISRIQSDTLQKSKQKTTIENNNEWTTFFIPGVVFQTYSPDIQDSLGRFNGVVIEYLIAAWIHKNDNRGPSHGRIYTKVTFLKSNKENINDIFYWGLGLDLSLERNPKRNYLIPYFGLEFGDMFQRQFGNLVTITPTLGVHLYSSQNLFVNLTGGYIYPTRHIEELRGYTVQLGVNFSLW
jgi:hypothetical protein